jgi:hypothetical protein
MANLHGMVVEKSNPVYDFGWLCNMMQKRNKVHIQGHEGVINGIRPEDGSGNNWLVTLSNNLSDITIFVKAS